MGRTLGIWGFGGLGRELLELARIINDREKTWDSFFFIVDGAEDKEKYGLEVCEYFEAKEKYADNLDVVVGIGEPVVRESKIEILVRDGVSIPRLIHPDVHIPKTTCIGVGVIVQYGCFISCGANISDYTYVFPLAGVGHDVFIGKYSTISSYSSLAGNVHIGDNTYIAPGTIVKENINIGNYSVIGLGSVVHRDIPDGVIAMGNPARPMKNNDSRTVFGG